MKIGYSHANLRQYLPPRKSQLRANKDVNVSPEEETQLAL